jgi:fatty acid desaturase
MSVAEAPRPTDVEAAFVRQAHQIVRDLMPANPVIYWVDFFVSATIAYTALWLFLATEQWSFTFVASFLVAGFGLYRTAIFIHELAHMPPTKFRLFRAVWNAGFGVPFLAPSFIYTDHRFHHTGQTYGTPGDSEYYPFGRGPVGALARRSLMMLIIPFFPMIRFGLLAPASLLHPTIRRLVWQRASSLGDLSPAYRRPDPDEYERRVVWVLESGCFAVVATLFGCLIAGVLPWAVFWKLYAVYLVVMIVNALRVYAAHVYLSGGEPMTFVEQMLDSTTIPGGPWSALWAPLGMRFHALHHLFPTMPYHSMATAHRRLMRELPADSPYHATLRGSLWGAIRDLVRNATAAPRGARISVSGSGQEGIR